MNGKVIGVIGTPAPGTRIGMARPCGWVAEGAQLWKLTVRGDELPGRSVVVDREFRPAR